jgi:PQQ-like domain
VAGATRGWTVSTLDYRRGPGYGVEVTFLDKLSESHLVRLKRAVVTIGVAGALIATTPAQAGVSAAPEATPSFNGTIWATAYTGGKIFVGGDFTEAVVNGKRIARQRLAAIDATTGELLPWAPSADARVKAIAVSGSAVYVAGEFAAIGGVKRDSLARLDASSGAVHGTFRHTILGKPYALAVASGRLYLGGGITEVDGHARTRLAAFNLATGALDTRWKPTADDQVESITATSKRIYVGGKFHRVNAVRGYDRLVALDPSSGAIDTGFRAKATYITFGIAVTESGVYAAHGGQGGRVAAYTLAGAARWMATFDGDPQALGVLGNTLYVGGHFDNVCRSGRTGDHGMCVDGAIKRVKLAAFATSDGGLSPWIANGNGVAGVLNIAIQPSLGKVAAGGAFTTINGLTRKRLVQFG